MSKQTVRKRKDDLPLRLEYLDPAELNDTLANWRTHPEAQLRAIDDMIAEAGWAGALLYNERTGRLIDGHARKDRFAGNAKVPILIGSWSEEQERKILATLDPVAAMATADSAKLDALLRSVSTESAGVESLLGELAQANGLADPIEQGAEKEPEAQPQGQEDELQQAFRVLIDCADEAEQLALIERLTEEGHTCRALTV